MIQLYQGGCLDIMPTIATASIDAIITDPPYPEIDREYGRMTEADWWAMMMGVCQEARRVLKPTGSAVFILQPNSRKVGSMRGWLWEFMAWVCREWNMVQDVWWWNWSMLPNAGTSRTIGLMRGSVKACVWAGALSCYRNQDVVLWDESRENMVHRASARFERKTTPSGNQTNSGQARSTCLERGGVTPFNLLPIANNWANGAKNGHGASTPFPLAKWWTRYICPPGGTVLDPFVGSGTMMLAAMEYGCNGIGIDKMGKYIDIAQRRIDEKQPAMSFAEAAS